LSVGQGLTHQESIKPAERTSLEDSRGLVTVEPGHTSNSDAIQSHSKNTQE
jgi:hypothetical protein